MLVGGRVVDGVHGPRAEQSFHQAAVPGAAEQRHDVDRRVGVAVKCSPSSELLVDAVQGEFASIEQHQPTCLQGQDLAAEFAADGATAPSDQHGLALDVALQQN